PFAGSGSTCKSSSWTLARANRSRSRRDSSWCMATEGGARSGSSPRYLHAMASEETPSHPRWVRALEQAYDAEGSARAEELHTCPGAAASSISPGLTSPRWLHSSNRLETLLAAAHRTAGGAGYPPIACATGEGDPSSNAGAIPRNGVQ